MKEKGKRVNSNLGKKPVDLRQKKNNLVRGGGGGGFECGKKTKGSCCPEAVGQGGIRWLSKNEGPGQ